MVIPDRKFYIYTALLTAFALLLRLVYQMGAEPLVHIAGDINDYVRYAWNLGQHGVYSSAPYDPATAPLSDSFRPPGYPLLLLLAVKLSGSGQGWLTVAYMVQLLLSTATVLLTTLLAREWMRPVYALIAGGLMALWPHHIVFASTLLSETLLGFCIILALWLSVLAYRKGSLLVSGAAGTVYGYAALVNSLIILFPLAFAVMLVFYSRWRLAAVLILAFSVLPAVWGVVGPPAVEGRSNTHRATMNLIQGSWPIYHAAWQAREHHEEARTLMNEIHAEIDLLAEDPSAGMEQVGRRILLDPAGYTRWYLLEKPYLLWAWDIKLGWGGVHFLPVNGSPMERYPIFRASSQALKWLNPGLFVLALGGVVVIGFALLKGGRPSFAGVAVALFAVYVTVLHAVFQAEPRYSIPYRPEQMILVCGMLAIIFDKVNPHLNRLLKNPVLGFSSVNGRGRAAPPSPQIKHLRTHSTCGVSMRRSIGMLKTVFQQPVRCVRNFTGHFNFRR